MRHEEIKKKTNEGLADLADMAERDHEVQMARSDLYKIAKYAIKLHEMLKGVSEAQGLEGWQQAKITKAADYISSVYHNLDYEMKFAEQQVAEAKKSSYKDGLSAMLESKKKLSEKSVSKNQQQLMGQAYAYKKGETKTASKAVKDLAASMSLKDLKDFASTKHKGLPDKVKEDAPTMTGKQAALKKQQQAALLKSKTTDSGMVDRMNVVGKGMQDKVDKTQADADSLSRAAGIDPNQVNKDIKTSLSGKPKLRDKFRKKTESKDDLCKECGKPSWKTLDEEKQKGVDGKVCWKGYKRMGTKKKGGKTVDNCVKM